MESFTEGVVNDSYPPASCGEDAPSLSKLYERASNRRPGSKVSRASVTPQRCPIDARGADQPYNCDDT
jgi:hypothetical protein